MQVLFVVDCVCCVWCDVVRRVWIIVNCCLLFVVCFCLVFEVHGVLFVVSCSSSVVRCLRFVV